MQYIWQYKDWPNFRWDNNRLIKALGNARFCQGKLLSKLNSLGVELNRETQAKILTEEAVKTSAIEGEILDRDSVRSSVARRLGLPTAGLPPINRQADGLVEEMR